MLLNTFPDRTAMPSTPSPFDGPAGQAPRAASQGSEATARQVRLLSAQEMRRLIWELVPLVDARSAQAFLSYHLPGAIHVPHDAENQQIRRVLPDPKQPLILYSNTMNRATALAQRLLELGYDNVSILRGGLSHPLALQDL